MFVPTDFWRLQGEWWLGLQAGTFQSLPGSRGGGGVFFLRRVGMNFRASFVHNYPSSEL